MTFEWDDEKNKINLEKHGIDFETAMLVFNDLQRIQIYDMEHSTEEDRYNTIGMVNDVIFVVYTERKENIRLISARIATKREIVYDDDSPELTPAMEKAFRLAAKNRNTHKNTAIS